VSTRPLLLLLLLLLLPRPMPLPGLLRDWTRTRASKRL
jgi:hypothetical protein